MRPVRAGVVGVGYLGRFHAQKYAADPRAELVGVADADPERAAQVAEELGAPVFSGLAELLPEVEAVSVVTPAVSHFELALSALEAGVHCLLEKPMTETLDQADRLLEAARARSLVLQVGLLERFNPALEALAGLVERPRYIEARRTTPFVGRGTDIDVVLELMIHDLDIVLSLTGEQPQTVRALGAPLISGKLDMANAYLEFPSGCVANLTSSRVSADPCRKIDIYHQGGRLAVDCAGRVLTVESRTREADAQEILPGIFSVSRSFGPQADPLALEIGDFLTCVRTGALPRVDGRAGREALALALRITGTVAGS